VLGLGLVSIGRWGERERVGVGALYSVYNQGIISFG